ncbi:MAG: hypothetical protein ACK5LJ_16960 [Paracoccus sp. (in: a-proteobacteria)]
MLALVISEPHQYTVRDVLETRPHPLHGRIFILSYDEFLSLPRLPRATWLFLDIERLSADDLAATLARLERLRAACPDAQILNRPERIRGRMEVMARLSAARINDFRVLPLDTPPDELRFPVFLRGIQDHDGPKSQLLHSPAELAEAIAALPAPEGHVITEYIDARNDEGLFEKRSYMQIGACLFPSALDTSRNWVCKGEHGNPDSVAQPVRELDFMNGIDDREGLQQAFALTGIDYGRADYAIVDGRAQIFEINTNPWLEPPEQVPAPSRSGAERMIAAWIDALATLERSSEIDRPEWLDIPGARPASTPRLNRRGIIHRALRRTGRLHRETRHMQLLRRLHLV